MIKSYWKFHSGIEPLPCDVFSEIFPFWNWTTFSLTKLTFLLKTTHGCLICSAPSTSGLSFHLVCSFFVRDSFLYLEHDIILDTFKEKHHLILDTINRPFLGEKHLISTLEAIALLLPMKSDKRSFIPLFPHKLDTFWTQKWLFCEEKRKLSFSTKFSSKLEV